ncbi:MAG: SPOR domain-containing protein, partial [Acidovorax sp.]|uniref:SPOR domain-containing protein n=1 Tax=Acidovorax sp. TaxID=1872122 RepID=UPI0039E40509
PARPPAVAPVAPAEAPPVQAAAAAASAPKPAASKPEAVKAESKPGADPLGDLAAAKAAAKGAAVDPFDYYVQAGAFRTQPDADAQRAKLAMLGWEAKVSEREQNGRPVFRVRVGPFTKREDAEQLRDKLEGTGVESALVRVQR